MKFEIDVAGYDLFNDKDYTICIASECGSIVKGFKFQRELITSLISNWKLNKYKYPYNISETKRGIFKVRIYSIILYYLFRTIPKQDFISFTICRDFKGRENEISQSLKFFLCEKIGIKTGKPLFQKLPRTSYAHIYAGIMRRDKKNFMSSYVEITLEDIEKYLVKKVTPKGI